MIGYKDPGPIGQPLGIFQQHKGRIIGVVKDFHFKSLHEPIEPLLINLKDSITRGFALVKTQAGKTREAIASLEKVCKQLAPKFPFTYYFADEEYKKLYNSEQTISKLSNCFSFLAIFISCLGLLGLMIFTAAQRTKEIGVRKVIGAGALDIVVLLSTDIFKLVALSAIIAMPISWMAMNHWLQGFAYRTDISWWVFAVAGFLAMIVALLTICYQALKAALADPVKNLRAD
jgi:ABC-type antimicrobial peptide transport system permease subunit